LRADDPARLDAVRDRLEAGLSALYGVELSDASGWQLDDANAIKPREGLDPQASLLLWREVTGKGAARALPSKPAVTLAVKPTADLALRPVEVWKGPSKALYGLVEVVNAMAETARQAVPDERVAHPLFDALRKPEVVRLAEGEVVGEGGKPKKIEAE